MRVNKEEETVEGQKINMATGTIKFSGLSHKRLTKKWYEARLGDVPQDLSHVQ